MMKIKHSILTLVVMLSCCIPASAQDDGYFMELGH